LHEVLGKLVLTGKSGSEKVRKLLQTTDHLFLVTKEGHLRELLQAEIEIKKNKRIDNF
jgi:predicted ABC-type exoprotein transport system permease subunit